MKKINKLTAAIAVALSIGMTPQADAVIDLEHNGKGDALLFPFYNGNPGWENYFTISNDSGNWIQGHIRFRGGSWCGELLDFDIILSPGDVFVFRLADIDGDGDWELDQSLDIRNFQYTGLVEAADQDPNEWNLRTSHCRVGSDASTAMWPCMDPSFQLVPEPDSILTAEIIDHQKHVGFIEFIGEAIFNGMNHGMMDVLMSANPGQWEPYQTDVFSRRGTSAWKWSNAEGLFGIPQFDRITANSGDPVWVGDRGLIDVPNVLSGVAFISQIGSEGVGLAYNAEALVNFRTGTTDHRIDNYRINTTGMPIDEDITTIANNRAIIVHHENGAASPVGTSPRGDYIYFFKEEDNGGLEYEGRISFNNTWGPTLADGDDYNLSRFATPMGNIYGTTDIDPFDGLLKPVNLRWTAGTGIYRFGDIVTNNPEDTEVDDFDIRTVGRLYNSIAEVEEAIRVDGQRFSGFYFDGGAAGPNSTGVMSLETWFHAWYPTKFFYGERFDYYTQTNLRGYIIQAARALVRMPKTYRPEVWDTEERTAGTISSTTVGECVSPAIGPECATETTVEGTGILDLAQCCAIFSIKNVKTAFSQRTASFQMGRVVLTPANNDPVVDAEKEFRYRYSWPGIIYSYEMGSCNDDSNGCCGTTSLVHWRMLSH